MMKKVLCLLCAVCAAAMSLCVACASPLTGDTSNMGLWIAMVVVAVIAVVVLLIVGAKRRKSKPIRQKPCAAWRHRALLYSGAAFRRGNSFSQAPCGRVIFSWDTAFFRRYAPAGVHAHLIQVSQAAQHIYGIVQHAYLVLRVCVLLHIQIFRHLLLGHAGIHTQAADIFIR